MKEIEIWILVWFLIWGIFNGFFKWFSDRFSYKKFIPRGFFFLISFVVIYFKYESKLLPHITDLVIGFVAANIIGSILSVNKNFYKEFVKDRFFILFQSFNILFQQAMILVAFGILRNYLGHLYSHYFFGLFFLIIHLPIIFFRKMKLRYLILLYCLLGGITFSYLYTNYAMGIVYSFLIHFSLYIWMIYYVEDEKKL